MKEYLVFLGNDFSSNYQLISTGNGWARTIIHRSELKSSGFKDYFLYEADDDWCDWWWEDEEE